MRKIWLIIWRFQPLHIGHKLLIQTSIKENPATLVLIGSSNKNDSFNPYSYELRKDCILSEFQESSLSIWALPDFESDIEWINFLKNYIPDSVTRIQLYCGDKKNDSAIQTLLSFQSNCDFCLNICEIPRWTIPISATKVRKWIQEKNISEVSKYVGKKTLSKLL